MNKRIGFAFLIVALALSLAAAQELRGPVSRDQILKDCPGWADLAAAYTPDPEAVAQLQKLDHPVQIDVYFGSWCSDSKLHVPAFIKVLDVVSSPLISVSYIGIPHDRAARAKFYGGKDIQRIPTFIVGVDGVEKGRIVETPAKSVERDLVDILIR
jgi:thiol-disulfide isomerase/thioredoxin